MLRTSGKKDRNLYCAIYFALGGWLTYVALLSGNGLKSPPRDRHTSSTVTADLSKSFAQGDLAPDGAIDAIEIPFSHPDGVFPDRSFRLRPDRWVFKGFSEKQLKQFFESCDLSKTEKDKLFDRKTWTNITNGFVITPSPEVVWSMNARARGRIYSMLARTSDNYSQFYAWRFQLGRFDERFRASGVSASTIEAMRRLTYTNEGRLCFADLEALYRVLKPAEFNDVTETLCTTPAFVLRLHVKENANADALIQYWGKGGREKLISPMINTLSRMPGGGQINVSYLLPPYARLRLYTFPDDWNDGAPLQDCTFTALNFFNEKADPRLFDMTYREHVLNTEYTVVEDKPAFGDIVTLLNTNSIIFHACVYIADGFVYTKNGINPEEPWIIMRFSDMLDTYRAVETVAQIQFRRRAEGFPRTVAVK